MYRLPVPPGENYVTSKPEWVEWESELPYNKCRSCCFFNGGLSVYQVNQPAGGGLTQHAGRGGDSACRARGVTQHAGRGSFRQAGDGAWECAG